MFTASLRGFSVKRKVIAVMGKGMVLAKIKIVIQGFIIKKRIERLKQKVINIRGEEAL